MARRRRVNPATAARVFRKAAKIEKEGKPERQSQAIAFDLIRREDAKKRKKEKK